MCSARRFCLLVYFFFDPCGMTIGRAGAVPRRAGCTARFRGSIAWTLATAWRSVALGVRIVAQDRAVAQHPVVVEVVVVPVLALPGMELGDRVLGELGQAVAQHAGLDAADRRLERVERRL